MDHTIRTQHDEHMTYDPYPRSLAIKCFCSECMGWDSDPVTECTSTMCPLFPYRGRKRHMTLEQRAAASERAKERFGADNEED